MSVMLPELETAMFSDTANTGRRLRATSSTLIVLLTVAILGFSPGMPSCHAQKKDDPLYSPLASIPQGKAVVYIYYNNYMSPRKKRKKPGGAPYYIVAANGIEIGTLGWKGYFPFITDPGTLEFSTKVKISKWKPALLTRAVRSAETFELEVEDGKSYFLSGTAVEFDVSGNFKMNLQNVSELVATHSDGPLGGRSIVHCHLITNKEKKGKNNK